MQMTLASRPVSLLGNELIATAIGDFAEGVPFEEWPHRRQFTVPPPGTKMVTALRAEQTIPDAVNMLARALSDLNVTFLDFARALGVADPEPIWGGSLESLAGRQLKWVYPPNADDDEFLKRATLLSTFVIDGLEPSSLRRLLLSRRAVDLWVFHPKVNL